MSPNSKKYHSYAKDAPRPGGAGIFITCRKGKEKQCVAEISNLFHSLSDEIWPQDDCELKSSKDNQADVTIEEQLRQELDALRVTPKRRFENHITDTPCLIYVKCNPPVNPVKLVLHYIEQVDKTNQLQTRYAERFTPVSATRQASLPDLDRLAEQLIPDAFHTWSPEACPFKIEIKIRNHSTIERQKAIDTVLKHVPSGYTINLDAPKIVIIVMIFKNICGISVIPDYFRYQKLSPVHLLEVKKRQARNEAVASTDDQG